MGVIEDEPNFESPQDQAVRKIRIIAALPI